MGYKVMLECPQTEVRGDGTFGHLSGELLPPDDPAALGWRPVIVEVDDEPEPPPEPEHAPAAPAARTKQAPATTPATRQTGTRT